MSSGSLLLVILAVSAATVREASAQSLRNDSACGACNCQFNNIDIFSSIMDAKIDARLNSAESRINSTLDAKIDTRLNSAESRINSTFNSLNSSLSSVASALAGQPGKWSWDIII